MKRYFFLCGCLLALFASSCSDDIMESGGAGNISSGQGHGEEIVITLPTHIPTYGQTRAKNPLEDAPGLNTPGTCTVTNCVVLVFSSNQQDGNYTCEKTIPLTFGKNQESVYIRPTLASGEQGDLKEYTRWVARGSFVPEQNKFYRLYAYAYDATSNYFSDNLSTEISKGNNKFLQNVDPDKKADELVTFTLPTKMATNDKPVEIFGAFLGAFTGGNWGEKADDGSMAGKEIASSTLNGISFTEEQIKDIHFGGDLKRQTGRLEITLTQIPENVAELSMVMGSYHRTEPVGMEIMTKKVDDNVVLYYYHNPCEVDQNIVVAKGQPVTTAENDRTITLTADMLRTEDSYVYIRTYGADGKELDTYTVRCKDKIVALGPNAIVENIVTDGKVTVPANFWLQLKGNYDQLIKGNMSFDVLWGEDYNSGISMGK